MKPDFRKPDWNQIAAWCRTALKRFWKVCTRRLWMKALSLLLAVLLNSKIKGRDVYRCIYFLPMVVAPAAVAMVWRWIFNAEVGILNQMLSVFGIRGPNWLSDPNLAIVSIAIIAIWSAVGYDLVMILAGLQSISASYYEAAEIDGANAVQRFFHITVPLISPSAVQRYTSS